jgi:hypothetical protein
MAAHHPARERRQLVRVASAYRTSGEGSGLLGGHPGAAGVGHERHLGWVGQEIGPPSSAASAASDSVRAR